MWSLIWMWHLHQSHTDTSGSVGAVNGSCVLGSAALSLQSARSRKHSQQTLQHQVKLLKRGCLLVLKAGLSGKPLFDVCWWNPSSSSGAFFFFFFWIVLKLPLWVKASRRRCAGLSTFWSKSVISLIWYDLAPADKNSGGSCHYCSRAALTEYNYVWVQLCGNFISDGARELFFFLHPHIRAQQHLFGAVIRLLPAHPAKWRSLPRSQRCSFLTRMLVFADLWVGWLLTSQLTISPRGTADPFHLNSRPPL